MSWTDWIRRPTLLRPGRRPLAETTTVVHSHLEFLSPLAPSGAGTSPVAAPPARVPLAAVPTSRPVDDGRSGVRTAIELAREGHLERLLFLVSKDAASPASVAALRALVARELHGQVPLMITALRPARGVHPAFSVDKLPLTSAFRRYGRGSAAVAPGVNEVGIKRNVALLMAHSLGLDRVLFLDDDVAPGRTAGPTLDGASLGAASAALDGGLAAVGWILRGYDDNSVVCRAARLAGIDQRQFIGGGALLTRVGADTPFFPAIYNEDWLFLLGLLDPHRPPAAVLGYGGVVLQDPYDGYAPRRARAEEFGDILGEGLMSLLHRGPNAITDAPDDRFWRTVVADRRELIHDVRRRLVAAAGPLQDPDGERAVAALDAALTVHGRLADRAGFWIDQFVRYVAAWQSDRDTWARLLEQGAGLPVTEVAHGRLLASREVFEVVDRTRAAGWSA